MLSGYVICTMPHLGARKGGGGAIADSQQQVLVRCRQSSIMVPVNARTDTVDILVACSDSLPRHLNTSSSVVVESYTQLGLERHLRRYERTIDVLNSWDRDTQHILVVVPQDHP